MNRLIHGSKSSKFKEMFSGCEKKDSIKKSKIGYGNSIEIGEAKDGKDTVAEK